MASSVSASSASPGFSTGITGVTASAPLRVAISGRRWRQGFTAAFTLVNTSGRDLTGWSLSFTTAHQLDATPWGATLSRVDLGGGLSRITLSGSSWGATLKAGASLQIGFSGRQGPAIGDSGALTADLLLAAAMPATAPAPPPAPDLQVEVSGNRWWNGFTAELRISNRSGRDLTSWSTSFDTVHRISGAPWGASLSSADLGNGLTRYTLTGSGWATGLKAGASVTVGFSGRQGASIGNAGPLTAEQLFSGQAAASPVTPPVTPPQPAATGYSEALRQSMLFYEAQRSGDLDEASKRIAWRGDSGLRDGRDGVYFGDLRAANLQPGLSLDLSGGYHDAGDHGKFGLPLAYTLSTLAWGGLAFREGYSRSGQLDDLLEAVRWGTDYLLKAHATDASGATRFFVAQVGDVAADHDLWSAPETQTIRRPALAVTPDKPGSDVAAGSAAALAAASILFRQNGNAAEADTLLTHATSLYRFADTYRGNYSDSITGVRSYYNSWSGYNDELSYGAAWLARAQEAAGADGAAYRQKALQLYRGAIGGLSRGWTLNWDDVSYGAAVLLAQDTGDSRILADVRGWLDTWVQGGNGVTITAGGLRHISRWGSLRYAANTAMVAGVVADSLIDPGGSYSRLAADTVDYILGENPRHASYVVGYGANAPQQPHHRGASGVGWEGFRNGLPNVHTLNGALVGGPDRPDDFAYADVRSDYIRNEVAIDYNAGFSGALAFLAQQQALA